MWNYKLDIKTSEELLKKLAKYSTVAGILFIILGLIGIFIPTFMTLTTVLFVSFLLLFAGISLATLTWMSNREDWMGWLKSFILIFVSIYMIFSPMGGVATVGLLLTMYFFMDAFANFGLAMSARNTHSNKTWWMWLINAVASFILGVIMIMGWPFSSLYLVGIVVGISLFIDGWVLLMGGKILKDIDKNNL
ncbi:MAG: DUF308 domain-containing protein [Sulfurovum sp.]|nr:DUF308 domain-containing protein [Sulfurovum sp.]